jgi:hypothetical protein
MEYPSVGEQHHKLTDYRSWLSDARRLAPLFLKEKIMNTENYPTFRKELGMKELSSEAMDKVKSEIANGKYEKDQVIEKIYESE